MGIENILAILERYQTAETGGDPEKILNSDFIDIIESILAPLPRASLPPLVRVDNATVRVEATANSPATIMVNGFPNIKNPTENVSGGLSDGAARVVTANVSMNFGAGNLYGAEKSSQWYAILAEAADVDTDYTLKAMPWIRVHAHVSQTIEFGTNLDATAHIGYGFTADEFIDGMIYVMTGASAGLMRTITANSNGATSPGTVTYSGAALTLAQGDWFIIFPPALNFKWLGDVWNNASGHITSTEGSLIFGRQSYLFTADNDWVCPFTWIRLLATGTGGGQGANSGGAAAYGVAGDKIIKMGHNPTPGIVYAVTIGTGGVASNPGGNGGATTLGALISIAGGTGETAGVMEALGLWRYGDGGDKDLITAGVDGFLLIEKP